MKSIACLTLLAILAVAVAQPVAKEPLKLNDDVATPATLEEVLSEPIAPVAHQRQKRATCDLLSFWNVNNTACAAHCLAKGFKGGYCNNKSVCVCRR